MFLAVSFCATGPEPAKHRILSVGAAVVDEHGAVCDGDHFHALMPFGDHSLGCPPDWDENAYTTFWTNPEISSSDLTHLEHFFLLYMHTAPEDETEAGQRLADWIGAMERKYAAMTLLVYNNFTGMDAAAAAISMRRPCVDASTVIARFLSSTVRATTADTFRLVAKRTGSKRLSNVLKTYNVEVDSHAHALALAHAVRASIGEERGKPRQRIRKRPRRDEQWLIGMHQHAW